GSAETNFDRVVPPMADTAQTVVRTLHQGVRREIWLFVEAIPPCLLPGFERHSSDLQPQDVAGTDVGSGSPGGRIEDYRETLQGEKRKGPQCAQCSLTTVCDGIWKEYARAFGTHELRPVSGLDPDYVASLDL
ncbi:MAG: hypothetical protein ACE5JM_09540, partial [Armatimonadota bacterium]